MFFSAQGKGEPFMTWGAGKLVCKLTWGSPRPPEAPVTPFSAFHRQGKGIFFSLQQGFTARDGGRNPCGRCAGPGRRGGQAGANRSTPGPAGDRPRRNAGSIPWLPTGQTELWGVYVCAKHMGAQDKAPRGLA